MKKFLQQVLAAIVGTLISFTAVFIFGLFFLILLISSMGSSAAYTVKPHSFLRIDLHGTLEERYVESPLNTFLSDDYPTLGLEQIISSIHSAAEEKNIRGIYLESGILSQATPGMAEEIREALLQFKKSGKPVICYGGDYSQTNYYISSVADKIILNPSGTISWQGLVSEPVFFKELLQRIGIQMQVFRVGNYKSAVEPFTSTEMSAANKEQIQSYLNSIWNKMVNDISASRHIPAEELKQYADSFLSLSPAPSYITCNMADTLMYQDEVKPYIESTYNNGRKIHFISPSELTLASQSHKTEQKNNIAVYYAFGDIVETSNSMNLTEIAADKMCRDLSSLAKDNSIDAVVIRINSGGGSAYASEQIWHSIQKLKEEKSVVVSMGGTAASGGYYIASAANEIMALPTTLTGSIGIFGLIPDASQLLKEKLGLSFDAVKTSTHADFGTPSRPFNSSEKQYMQRYINEGYKLFITRVSEGRKISREKTEEVAQGRVWTGEQALENGLADRLGTLQDAIERAAQLAGIKEYGIRNYPAPKSWYEELIGSSKDKFIESQIKAVLGNDYAPINLIKKVKQLDPVQARMPYDLNLNI